jgi:hypothetical protein
MKSGKISQVSCPRAFTETPEALRIEPPAMKIRQATRMMIQTKKDTSVA